jgi:hypothetical protein
MNDDNSEESLVADRTHNFLVNALDCRSAAILAKEHAPNELFKDCLPVVDELLPLPLFEHHPLASCEELGSYCVTVLRRGYRSSSSSGEHSSDYAILDISGPYPLSEKADLIDSCPEYLAKVKAIEHAKNLDGNVSQAQPTSKIRI